MAGDPNPLDMLDAGQGLLESATAAAASAGDAATAVHAKFAALSAVVDTASWGLLSLALVLAIFHEHYQCQCNETRFGTWKLALRFFVTLGLLLGYSKVVWLITSAAGGWGDWMGWDDLLAPVIRGGDDGWELHTPPSAGDLGMVFGLVKYFLFYGVLVACSLFALVANLLISISQGLMIAILLSLGKVCIAASLVPGVGLAKSWARLLAMVAAWSTIGGTAAAVIFPGAGDSFERQVYYTAMGGDSYMMLMLSGKYVVFALFTLATPFITSAIFSGAIGSAPGVGAALFGAAMGARMLVQSGLSGGRAAAGAAGRAADRGVGGLRHKLGIPRKVDRSPLGNLGGDRGPRGGGGGGRSGGADAGGARGAGAAGAARPRPLAPEAPIPRGRPGEAAWRKHAAPARQKLFARRQKLPPGDRIGVPPANKAMHARAAEHRGTLKKAYPDLSWDPTRLSKQERAILDELDNFHGRFKGWDAGAQGHGDFRAARALADGRAVADSDGVARAARPYAVPSWAAQSGGSPAVGSGAAGAGAGAADADAGGADNAAAVQLDRDAGVDTAVAAVSAGTAAPTVVDAAPATRQGAPTRPDPARGDAAVVAREGAPTQPDPARTAADPPGAITRPQVHRRVIPREATARSGPPAEAPAAHSKDADTRVVDVTKLERGRT